MYVQVTTSSQRDQDDENILIVDSESDEEIDGGPVEPDDAIQFEDEGDNVEQFEEAQGNFSSTKYLFISV